MYECDEYAFFKHNNNIRHPHKYDSEHNMILSIQKKNNEDKDFGTSIVVIHYKNA